MGGFERGSGTVLDIHVQECILREPLPVVLDTSHDRNQYPVFIPPSDWPVTFYPVSYWHVSAVTNKQQLKISQEDGACH